MSDTKTKAVKTKKEQPKKSPKPTRAAVAPTEENLLKARAAAVVDFSVPEIRKILACTWKEACTIRHEALKRLQWFNQARNTK